MAKTLYEILGVPPSASRAQLQAAFNKIKRELGKAGDKQSMEALQIAREAFTLLSNPDKRANYDQKLAQQAGLNSHDNLEDTPLWHKTLPAQLNDLSAKALPDHRFTRADWNKRPRDFSFMQKPPFLILLALLAAFIYWTIESEKIHLLEAQLQANERAIAQAIAEKNEAFKLRQEAQAQIELARQQDAEAQEAKRIELENRRIEIESRRIEVEQNAIDANREVAIRQIDSGATLANRSMDIAAAKAQTEAQMTSAKARVLETEARKKQFAYDRDVQDESSAIRRETALFNKYRQQEINGEDRLTRSNPGLGR